MIASEFPPGPGGIANHAWQLALNLHRLGWRITVLSPQDYVTAPEIVSFNSSQPFRIVRVPSGRGRFRELLNRVRSAHRLVREEQPDALLATGLSGVWVTAATAAITRLPSLAIAHGSELAVPGVVGAVNRRAFDKMNAVVAVSRFTAGLLQNAGIQPRRLEVITNAADPDRFPAIPAADCTSFRVQ